MTFSPDASDVYRTHVTKFVPSSGYNQPSLDEIRALLAQYETVMNGFTTNGGLIYQTMAAMNAAATTFTEPRSAWQFEAGSEGVYVLNPSTDTWTKVGRLPYDFVIGTDTGAGTANAIQITTDIPVADGMIVAFSLFEATTGTPVTVSINGGSALTLKTNRGNNASALTAGMEIWGRVRTSDNTLRLLNDQDVSALVAQADAAAAAAAASAASLAAIDQRVIVICDDTNRVTYPEFSALVVDGDWAPAFNAAMLAGRFVEVPPGDYLCKTQVVFQQEGQVLRGIGGPRPNGALTGAGARLVYDSALSTTPMVHAKYTGHVNRLAFKGPAKGTGTGILAKKPTDYGEAYEDTDIDISECTFEYWLHAVEHWNRGLNLESNSIALCTRAVNFEGFDSANFVDSVGNVFDNIPEGFRAIRLHDNRIHATDIAFENTGLNAGSLRGLVCSKNLMDIGDALWHGGLFSGLFADNVIDQTSASVGFANFTTAVTDVSIIGNRMSGDPVQGIPVEFIEFAGAVNMLNMSGNSIRSASSYGVNFTGAVAGGLITGNTWQAIGTAGNTTRACIRAQSTLTNLAITGNYFDPTTDAYCVRGSTGQAWTGVTIQGNTWNRSRTLSGVYTDGGNNSIQT